jgi:hypothetical protein
LYKSAQEQLKKVEEIKKVTKEVRDEAEDWQSVSADDIVVNIGLCKYIWLYWQQICLRNYYIICTLY